MSDFFQQLFVHNFWLKLISVLLAGGLWMVVASDPAAEIETRVPIEFRNLPDNLEIDSATFTEARILVRGPERIIRRLRPTDVLAQVDLTGAAPGERTFDLTARHIHLPQDLQVVQIIPSQFQLSFDFRLTRTVPIHPRVTGTFATGLRIGQITTDPAAIAVIGPRRRVEALEAATTDPVDVSGAVNRATFVTQATVSDPLVQIVHPTPVRVTVMMEREGEK